MDNAFVFVTGSIPQPVPTFQRSNIDGSVTPVPNPDHQLWFQTDQIVQSWFLGYLSEQLHGIVLNCTTSCEIQHKLQTVTKTNKTMSAYLHEIKSLSDQLASIGNPISETMKIFSALRGLGRDYEPIKTTIESAMDNVPSPTF